MSSATTSPASVPRWSVMIPVHDCADFLRESLTSVLDQDPGREQMHIEVLDDASCDDPAAVVAAVGGDRVTLFRHPRHVGLIANLNTCLERARGELVHILHGDDRVESGFYEAMRNLFDRHPEIGAAFCRVRYLDARKGTESLGPDLQAEPGVLTDAFERIFLEAPLTTAGTVVRREVYQRVGGFDPRLTCCAEDWEMWTRIALQCPFGYEPRSLAVYRLMREGSLTLRTLRSGAFTRDMRVSIEIVESYLHRFVDAKRARQLSLQAREGAAQYILVNLAPQVFRQRPAIAGLRIVLHAFRCRFSRSVVRTAGALLKREAKMLSPWTRGASTSNHA